MSSKIGASKKTIGNRLHFFLKLRRLLQEEMRSFGTLMSVQERRRWATRIAETKRHHEETDGLFRLRCLGEVLRQKQERSEEIDWHREIVYWLGDYWKDFHEIDIV